MNIESRRKDAAAYTDRELILRLLRLSGRYRGRAALAVATQLLVLGLTLSGLALLGLGVDIIRHRHDLTAPRLPFGLGLPDGWTYYRSLTTVAGAILAGALLRALVTYANTMLVARLVQDVVIDLRARAHDKLQRLSFRFFDANESGSIINRVTTDVQQVRMFVDGVLIQVVILALTLAINLAYMTGIHARLTAVCMATTPLLWLMTLIYARAVRPLMLAARLRLDRLITVLSENVQGAHVVKGFDREGEEISRFRTVNRGILDCQQAIFSRTAIFAAAVGMATHLNIVLLIGYGGYLVMSDRLALGGGLLVFYGLLHQFSDQVATIANIANSAQRSLTGAERFFSLLDTPVEILSAPDARPLPRARGDVRFEKVGFAYEPGKPVLRDIDLDVRPGQCVAILGPTGAGKSVLLSLIPRFYDPTSGRVLIDGMDARALRLEDLRRNVGLVFQESFLFSNTVAANIAFGCPDATRERIERAARVAHAHDFIMRLEHGYDHIVGERGLDLSGGQRQRLALARAILPDPAILLLDDPMAAVDPETEHDIRRALDAVMRGRTAFIVSHRISPLRRADLIVVLQKGRIVQTGTHDQLMRIAGHYREIADIQFDQEAHPPPLAEAP